MDNRRHDIGLANLENDIIQNNDIVIKTGTIVKADDLVIIKRDGREEPYDVGKMRRVCLWACNQSESFCNSLLESTRIKLYQKMKIENVYDELIKTAVNKISRIAPTFEYIAAKLYLLKIYKETWQMKRNTKYPNMSKIIKKGYSIKRYDHEIFDSYTFEEINELSEYIKPERDFLFTYKALYMFVDKYCANANKSTKLELPQHVYMRISMSLFYKEPKQVRLKYVMRMYDVLSQHQATLATPIMINSGSERQQLSSCILSQVDDNTTSIMNTAKNIAIYSKYKGGTAVDVSKLRASGSYIYGNGGFSSGPVPFIKILESTIKAFNQGSMRPGACCIYFNWWHKNVFELIVLKNNGGTEENRARQLKYAIKLNELFIQRVLDNETITLFDPNQVTDLYGLYGEQFAKKYIEYEQKCNSKQQKINARILMGAIFKERAETGNIYLFHEENVNSESLLNRYINSSNLCTEITLPSRAQVQTNYEISYDENMNSKVIETYQRGEIALCNLGSINLVEWGKLDKKSQQDLIDTVVRGLDNTIDVAFYPIKDAKLVNQKYRYLGIGVLNYTNYLASKKIIIDTQEALEMTHKIFDELSYQIIFSSVNLAKEKGPFAMFKKTKWSEGKVPIMMANQKALALTEYQPNMQKWQQLSDEIRQFGIRNAQLMAIAPTATSGKAINATESIEPIQNFFYKEDGKINLPTLAPNIKNNSQYYKTAFDCDQYALIRNAAIRQCYLDQSQSINIYFKKVTSVTAFSLLHFYGFALGIKTFYYCRTEKDSADDVCESCT